MILMFCLWLTMLISGLIVASIALQGYVGFGITKSSFREGLINTLEKLEMPFEKNRTSIDLPSIGANLRISIQSWLGTVQISVRPHKFNGVLREIVQGMSSYYQTTNGSVNRMTGYVFLIFGAIMMALSVWYVYFFRQYFFS